MNNYLSSIFLIAFLLSGAVLGFGQTVQKITLKDAEKIAIANHPRVQEAQMTALAAGERTKEARSAYFPMLFGSLTGAGALDKSRLAAGGLNNPIIFNRYSNGITASQLVTDFGRTQNLVASARLDAQSRQQDVNTTRADIQPVPRFPRLPQSARDPRTDCGPAESIPRTLYLRSDHSCIGR